MKQFSKSILLLLVSMSIVAVSCDSYLDKQEDESLTFEKIWTKRATTLQYFYNAWSFMPSDLNAADNNPWTGASDEATCTYNRAYRWMNFGSWGPSNVPYDNYSNFYQGIREANIFIHNIDKCSSPDVNDTEKLLYKTRARFASAYYHWLLMRIYGPIILVRTEIVDINKSLAEFQTPRNTWQECVEYVCSELEECAKILPNANEIERDDFGMPTKGTCYAVIGRLKLYNARPLFNGNTLYSDVANPDGTNLFPTEYDAELWKEAADANKKVIDLEHYELYDTGNPIESYLGVGNVEWNNEIIFTRRESALWKRWHSVPRAVGGAAYGGIGPTQQLVDAYAMKNGKYPITGYNNDGTPIIDATSGYVEEGTSSFVNPLHKENVPNGGNRNMYKDREPRFYATVFWSSDYWNYGKNKVIPVFAFNGNSGPGASHDYPKSGYLVQRFIDHTKNTNAGEWGNITFPLYRLAETYLNYAEALNEYYGPSNSDILKYINKIRKRAGVPNLETVYPDCVSNKDLMRDLIRKERQIELAFENHRYFDTRTWMIAEKTDNGKMWGMNINAVAPNVNTTPEAFWQRTVFETRVFEKKHYLYPFSQRELDRNKSLTQNYGW